MAKPKLPDDQLRKKAKVVAVEDLRGVPAGTPGRVILVDGFTWIRYWVRFDNGVDLGSISRPQLATADEWSRHLSGDLVLGGTAAGAGDGAAAESDGGAADDG